MTEPDWPNIVIAVISGLALVVALLAAAYARQSNRLVGLYNRALWTHSAAVRAGGGMAEVTLTNRGSSTARDVRLVLDVDPLHAFSDADAVELVPEGGTATFWVAVPNSHDMGTDDPERGMQEAWRTYFMREDLRGARVIWQDLENRRREQVITLPHGIPTAGQNDQLGEAR